MLGQRRPLNRLNHFNLVVSIPFSSDYLFTGSRPIGSADRSQSWEVLLPDNFGRHVLIHVDCDQVFLISFLF